MSASVLSNPFNTEITLDQTQKQWERIRCIHKQLWKLHSRELKSNEAHYNEQVNNANKNLYNVRSVGQSE